MLFGGMFRNELNIKPVTHILKMMILMVKIVIHVCMSLTNLVYFCSPGADGSEGGLSCFFSRFGGMCGLPSSLPEPTLQPLGNTKRR